jgi:uncharacterized membrane protein YeaQ/YmgE (transglycosylase-associated protein family)
VSVWASIVLGLLAGSIFPKIVNKRGEGPLSDLVLGIDGAMVRGDVSRWQRSYQFESVQPSGGRNRSWRGCFTGSRRLQFASKTLLAGTGSTTHS